MIELKNIKPKILVIGDLMIDNYLWGSSDRISPEAPVPVINVNSESSVLGGAGNVINNLHALGADVNVLSVVGICETSEELIKLLKKIQVDTQNLVIEKNRVTSKKTRIIASQQQVIRYDVECSDEISEISQNSIIKRFKKIVLNYDLILLSDYGKGLLTLNLTQKIISIAKEHNKRVLVDPKGLNYEKYSGAFLLTPNKKEASEAVSTQINNIDSLKNAISNLKKKFNLTFSLITLSDQGVAVFDNKLRIHPTVAKEVFDVTGAGDTILAALGYALSCNQNIDEAVKFANLAAGVVVGKIGSATATINEIIEYESNLNKSSSNNHIKTWKQISDIVDELKNKNKKIVFTNGCFDILHLGHVKYLEKAKSFGDKLIIGLNSDTSVKKLKGKDRPINTQEDRAYILASMEIVDFVVIFDQDHPLDLITLIKPDVLVKGGDYADKAVVGQDIVEEFKIVPFIPGKSTSLTLKKIMDK